MISNSAICVQCRTCAHETQCPLRALVSIRCVQTTRCHARDLWCP